MTSSSKLSGLPTGLKDGGRGERVDVGWSVLSNLILLASEMEEYVAVLNIINQINPFESCMFGMTNVGNFRL